MQVAWFQNRCWLLDAELLSYSVPTEPALKLIRANWHITFAATTPLSVSHRLVIVLGKWQFFSMINT